MGCRIYILALLIVTELTYADTSDVLGTYINPKCYNYGFLQDKNLLTDYTGNAAGMTNLTLTAGWYRIIATNEGVMVKECQQGNECGTNQQAWFTGMIPQPNKNTTTNATVCIRKGKDCCARNITIEVVHCYIHLVYNLVPLEGNERYCFYAETDKLNSVTTSTTTVNTTLPLVQPDSGGPPIALIAAIVAVVLLAAIIACIVIAAKKRSRYQSRNDPNAYFFRFGVGRHIFDISTLGTDILINPQRLVDLINIDAPLGATRRKFDIRALKHNRRAISASDAETNLSTATTNGFPKTCHP